MVSAVSSHPGTPGQEILARVLVIGVHSASFRAPFGAVVHTRDEFRSLAFDLFRIAASGALDGEGGRAVARSSVT